MTGFTYTARMANHEYLSESQVFSGSPITSDQVENLIYAQTIVEAQWLSDFPMIAIEHKPEMKHHALLYGNVSILFPDSWYVFDDMDCFLANREMMNLLRASDGDLSFRINDSYDLIELLRESMFIVATVK